MATFTHFDQHNYSKFLTLYNFNEEQIQFLFDQRTNYEYAKRSIETVTCDTCNKTTEISTFDADTYEREMWYTMNRSGLFENEPENKTGITNWNPTHTRQFITECN